ncbi:hypothetical protein [Geodermatophilus sp. SYSU D00684]
MSATVIGTALVGAAGSCAVAVARRLAHWGATPDEVRRRLPGDELVPGGRATVTTAVTIDAPVAQVWPWIVQIGRGRAGFYTYTWLENLLGADIHDLDRVAPDLQHLAVGDRIWLTPERYLGRIPGQAWRVAAVDPEHVLVLEQRPPENPRAGTWSLVLEAAGAERTRLISRHCTPPSSGLLARAAAAFWSLSSVMERGMLLGIKERAETRRPATTGAVAR